MQYRGGRRAKKLAAHITEKLGVPNPDVWYEPINGPCMEMEGYAGGWYWSEEPNSDFGDPIGYSLKEAMELIDLKAKVYAE